MRNSLAWLYAMPLHLPLMWLRITVAVIWWTILSCCVALAFLAWLTLVGWWLPAVIRPRVRF
jgi:hypothetical protein